MTYHEPILMTAEQWAQQMRDLRWLARELQFILDEEEHAQAIRARAGAAE